MIVESGPFTLATKVWLPISIVLMFGLVYLAIRFFRNQANDSEDRTMIKVIGGFAAAIALILASLTAWGFFPYKGEYHRWAKVVGTVESTNKRIVPAGEGTIQERYVIKFQESPELFGCDDTRCALATPGKQMELRCKRVYQYAAQSGWACNYNQKD